MGYLNGKPAWVQHLQDSEALWIKEFGDLNSGPPLSAFEEINGKSYVFAFDPYSKTTTIISKLGKTAYTGDKCPIPPNEPDDYYPNSPEADQYEEELDLWVKTDYQFFLNLIQKSGIW